MLSPIEALDIQRISKKERIPLQVISMGRQWLILLFTIGRMLMVIGGVTHVPGLPLRNLN